MYIAIWEVFKIGSTEPHCVAASTGLPPGLEHLHPGAAKARAAFQDCHMGSLCCLCLVTCYSPGLLGASLVLCSEPGSAQSDGTGIQVAALCKSLV